MYLCVSWDYSTINRKKVQGEFIMPEKYSAVMQLGRHSDVMLLRDTSSGKLVVRRRVGIEQAKIYQKLRNIKQLDIPAIYDILKVENEQYEIIEEYIEGITLEEMIQEKGTILQPLAVCYIMWLCDVLAKIHKAGIIHRDIKPSNIILTPDDRLYLIDFDIARFYKEKQVSDTVILGTRGYAAPEQFGFQQTDKRTDIYAAGVLLNKLLTGKLPQECLPQIRMAQIVLRCTKIDSAKRYQNARELKKALRRYHPRYPKVLAFLREIPGFRSFKIWKMITAVCIYGIVGISLWSVIPEQLANGEMDYVELAEIFSWMLFVFFFIFDCFQIRSRIKWLEKSRGGENYFSYCFLVIAVASQIISFIFEKCVSGLLNIWKSL